MKIDINESSSLILLKQWIPKDRAEKLLNYYLSNLTLKQDEYNFSGKIVYSPRLIALMGNSDYHYSGINHSAIPFDDITIALLKRIKRIPELENYDYNGCLFNLYRDGMDSISYHSDNENGLDYDTPIVSISLGETRTFKIKHNKVVKSIELESGDLAIMYGDFQRECQHAIVKEPNRKEKRLSLTFRKFV